MLTKFARHRHPRERRNGRGRKHVIITLSAVLGAAAIVAVSLAIQARSGGRQQTSIDRPVQTAQAVQVPKSWKLTFNSNFSGSKLDNSTWATCYPWSPDGCRNFGNDNEREWYLASQDQVQNGVLSLVAQREPTEGRNQEGAAAEYACRSGMVTTYPSFRFEYGYVQVTASIPFGTGLWPAFWLAAADQKWPPEIDILEHWGTEPKAKIYLHPTEGKVQGGPITTPGLSTGWHTFTIYWAKSRLSWYYDGRQVMTITTGVPQQAMYLIANLAVFNANRGGCTGSLNVKSVKVWQPQK